MAFESFGLIVGRGDIFNIGTSYSSSLNIYKSIYDPMSEIITEDYFPPYLGEDERTILIGDVLFIQDKNLLTQLYIITSINPVILSNSFTGNPYNQDLNTDDNVNFNSVVSNVMATGVMNATQSSTTQLIVQNEYIQTGLDTLFSPFPVSIQFGGCFNPPHILEVWLSRFTRGSVGMARILISGTAFPQRFDYARTNFMPDNTLPIGFRPVIESSSIQLGMNSPFLSVVKVPIQLKLFPNGNIDVYGGIRDLEPFDTGPIGGFGTGWQQMEMTYPVTT